MTVFSESFNESSTMLPVMFVGHGSPMNAISDNEFSRAWQGLGSQVPLTPKAILCISAHYEAPFTCVTTNEAPPTLYDFMGFPEALYRVRYPAAGSPALADLITKIVPITPVRKDDNWGLDHGAWSVLSHMFPKAEIPVVQMSLDYSKPPEFHYRLGRSLRSLRQRGGLIVGSGNIVHNLRMMKNGDMGYDWAVDFDDQVKAAILSGDHDRLIEPETLGAAYSSAIPTWEHYLPMLYILALKEPEDNIRFFTEKITLGSISMRSFILGS